MSLELTRHALTLSTLEQGTALRRARDRDAQWIVKQGAEHSLAERVQAAKAALALDLVDGLYDRAHANGDTFYRDGVARLEAPGRSETGQALYEGFSAELFARHDRHVLAVLDTGAGNITREASKGFTARERRFWEF